MKPNEPKTAKSRLMGIIGDYLTVAFAAGAWCSYGPRGWPMDETVMRLLYRQRTATRSPAMTASAAPAVQAECCMPAPQCCAG